MRRFLLFCLGGSLFGFAVALYWAIRLDLQDPLTGFLIGLTCGGLGAAGGFIVGLLLEQKDNHG